MSDLLLEAVGARELRLLTEAVARAASEGFSGPPLVEAEALRRELAEALAAEALAGQDLRAVRSAVGLCRGVDPALSAALLSRS